MLDAFFKVEGCLSFENKSYAHMMGAYYTIIVLKLSSCDAGILYHSCFETMMPAYHMIIVLKLSKHDTGILFDSCFETDAGILYDSTIVVLKLSTHIACILYDSCFETEQK